MSRNAKEVLLSVRVSYQQYEVPLSRMLHDILDNAVTPSIDRTLHQFLIVTDLDLIHTVQRLMLSITRCDQVCKFYVQQC